MSSSTIVNVGQYDPGHRVINDMKNCCPSGWTPIPDVDEGCVHEAAKHGVAEYNMEYNETLKYEGILRAWYMELKEGGLDYGFVLEAVDCVGRVNRYKVVVSEDKGGGEKIWKLKTFMLFQRNN